MSRQETRYQWSQKYAFFRKHFQSGTMSPEAWKRIDSAYDVRCRLRSCPTIRLWSMGEGGVVI